MLLINKICTKSTKLRHNTIYNKVRLGNLKLTKNHGYLCNSL